MGHQLAVRRGLIMKFRGLFDQWKKKIAEPPLQALLQAKQFSVLILILHNYWTKHTRTKTYRGSCQRVPDQGYLRHVDYGPNCRPVATAWRVAEAEPHREQEGNNRRLGVQTTLIISVFISGWQPIICNPRYPRCQYKPWGLLSTGAQLPTLGFRTQHVISRQIILYPTLHHNNIIKAGRRVLPLREGPNLGKHHLPCLMLSIVP